MSYLGPVEHIKPRGPSNTDNGHSGSSSGRLIGDNGSSSDRLTADSCSESSSRIGYAGGPDGSAADVSDRSTTTAGADTVAINSTISPKIVSEITPGKEDIYLPGGVSLGYGIKFVDFTVPPGSVEKIVRFYEYFFRAIITIAYVSADEGIGCTEFPLEVTENQNFISGFRNGKSRSTDYVFLPYCNGNSNIKGEREDRGEQAGGGEGGGGGGGGGEGGGVEGKGKEEKSIEGKSMVACRILIGYHQYLQFTESTKPEIKLTPSKLALQEKDTDEEKKKGYFDNEKSEAEAEGNEKDNECKDEKEQEGKKREGNQLLNSLSQSLPHKELETSEKISFEGHHIALYMNNFIEIYNRVKPHNLHWDNPRFPQFTYRTLENVLTHNEFRVKDIIDPLTGEKVFELEHEIRYEIK